MDDATEPAEGSAGTDDDESRFLREGDAAADVCAELPLRSDICVVNFAMLVNGPIHDDGTDLLTRRAASLHGLHQYRAEASVVDPTLLALVEDPAEDGDP